MAVGFGSSSSINCSDETLGCKSLQLICIHSIEDGVLRFGHVVGEEEASGDRVNSIMNRCLRFQYDSRSSPSALNLSCYNSSDAWLILNHFKISCSPFRVHCVFDESRSRGRHTVMSSSVILSTLRLNILEFDGSRVIPSRPRVLEKMQILPYLLVQVVLVSGTT